MFEINRNYMITMIETPGPGQQGESEQMWTVIAVEWTLIKVISPKLTSSKYFDESKLPHRQEEKIINTASAFFVSAIMRRDV